MFGYTFANLEDELGFVEKNLSWLPADSLLLLDLPMVFAPASSPSEVVQRDPALSEQRPSEWRHRVEEFLTGPIHRYSGGVLDVTITKALDNRATTVPGSYTINTSASVRCVGPVGNEVPTESLQTLGESSHFVALGVAHEEVAARSVCETDSRRMIDGVAAWNDRSSVVE